VGASGAPLDRPTDGLTKILFDPKTERVLGVGIVGVGAGEMIRRDAAIEMAAVATDLAMTIHAHPTSPRR
jgi:dihydrolipoamide dehydrogenase